MHDHARSKTLLQIYGEVGLGYLVSDVLQQSPVKDPFRTTSFPIRPENDPRFGPCVLRQVASGEGMFNIQNPADLAHHVDRSTPFPCHWVGLTD